MKTNIPSFNIIFTKDAMRPILQRLLGEAGFTNPELVNKSTMVGNYSTDYEQYGGHGLLWGYNQERVVRENKVRLFYPEKDFGGFLEFLESLKVQPVKIEGVSKNCVVNTDKSLTFGCTTLPANEVEKIIKGYQEAVKNL